MTLLVKKRALQFFPLSVVASYIHLKIAVISLIHFKKSLVTKACVKNLKGPLEIDTTLPLGTHVILLPVLEFLLETSVSQLYNANCLAWWDYDGAIQLVQSH